jgi:hypothetical protein
MTASGAVAREAGAAATGVNAEDGSRTDDGYLFEFALALAARDADASRVRYCDTIGGDPGVLRPARRVHPPRQPARQRELPARTGARPRGLVFPAAAGISRPGGENGNVAGPARPWTRTAPCPPAGQAGAHPKG